jgi:hypothetical protein
MKIIKYLTITFALNSFPTLFSYHFCLVDKNVLVFCHSALFIYEQKRADVSITEVPLCALQSETYFPCFSSSCSEQSHSTLQARSVVRLPQTKELTSFVFITATSTRTAADYTPSLNNSLLYVNFT